MKKDKEWLKEELRKIASRRFGADFETDNEIGLVVDELDEPEKVVIPQFMADFIEESKNDDRDIRSVFYQIIKGGLVNLDADEWIENNPETFARVWLDSYTIEQPKTYRFTLNAFHEIDVNATSLEEAQKEADKTWNQYFVRYRDFGEAEFEGEVDEDGDLNG